MGKAVSAQGALFAKTVEWSLGRPWEVRPVNRGTAEAWFGKYHYSGTAGTAGGRCFGVFAGDAVSMIALGPTSNASGLASRYGLSQRGNIEIVRVAVHPDTPKNTASRSVAAVCRHYSQETGAEWVFSYADTGQGHHGGIYQALNAVYVGVSPARRGYMLDGEPIHPRSVVSRFGTESWPRVRALAEEAGHTLERVEGMNTAKHTYILPIGGPASRREIRKVLEPHSKPYPERSQVLLRDDDL